MNKEEMLEALSFLEEVANENDIKVTLSEAIDMLEVCDTVKECHDWIIENV